MKRALACIFTFIIIFSPFSVIKSSADQEFPDAIKNPDFHFRISFLSSSGAYADVLKFPGYPDQPYYLFLPADCSRNQLRITFSETWLKINGCSVKNGDTTDLFQQDGAYSIETPNGEFSLQVVSSAHLPSVFISTETGTLNAVHADKAHKEPAVFTLADQNNIVLEDVPLTYIKGRGNTSWRSNEKKSYNIKFESAVDLFGMGKAKKWVLTSNNIDPTLMRNAIAYTAAKYTVLPYTVDFVFVDLYINGIYRGNYMLSEKIEIGENRININDLEKDNKKSNPKADLSDFAQVKETINGNRISWYDLPNDPTDITGGYLLEYEYPDQFDTEPCSFMTKTGQCLIVHSPEYASKNEMLYVSSLYWDFEEALLAKNGVNKKGKSFTEYIDVDSFIDGLLLYELTEDADRGHTSWYIYIPQGENKLYMGPVWDFDIGMDVAEEELRCVSSFANAAVYGIGKAEDITFIDLLCSHQTVLNAMAERFPVLASAFSSSVNDHIESLFAKIESSSKADLIRWGYSAEGSSDRQISIYTSKRTKHISSDFNNLNILTEQKIRKIKSEKNYYQPALVLIGILSTIGVGIMVLLIAFRNSCKKRNRRTP